GGNMAFSVRSGLAATRSAHSLRSASRLNVSWSITTVRGRSTPLGGLLLGRLPGLLGVLRRLRLGLRHPPPPPPRGLVAPLLRLPLVVLVGGRREDQVQRLALQ